jgi:iron complex outermembrane receptor protein
VTFLPVDISFGDESTEGFEVGLKARWFDRQVTTNLAFYDYKYNGLQVGISESGTTSVRTINAGSAKIYGVDFDLAYRPEQIDGLELHTSVEWNHARFKQLDGVPCWGGQLFSEGCNQGPTTNRDGTPGFTAQSLAGYPLQRAPDWQVSGGFSYEQKLNNGMSVLFSSDSQYSTRYLTVLGINRSDYFQPSYFKTDASLTLKGAEDRWEIALIGKNLTDKLTRDNCSGYDQHDGLLSAVFGTQNKGGTTRGPGGKDDVACFISRGREFWIRLTFRPFK